MDRAIEIRGDPAFFRRVNYGAVALGFVVAMLVNAGLVRFLGGLVAAGLYVVIASIAMYCGGLVAGLVEPKYGVLNAPLIAALVLLVAALLGVTGSLGSVSALGLGPLRVERVFETDFPMLLFSSLGGLTAGLVERRVRGARLTTKKDDGKER